MWPRQEEWLRWALREEWPQQQTWNVQRWKHVQRSVWCHEVRPTQCRQQEIRQQKLQWYRQAQQDQLAQHWQQAVQNHIDLGQPAMPLHRECRQQQQEWALQRVCYL